MRTNNYSDSVLVYERYYKARPHPLSSLLKKLVLCCGMTVCTMLYVFTEYEMPLSLTFIAGVSLALSAFFTVVFFFVRKRIAVPLLAAVAGLSIWLVLGKRFTELITYFADSVMAAANGRFFNAVDYLFHEPSLLTASNPDYLSGVALGGVIVCALFSLISAAAFSHRIRVLPPLVSLIVLCIPTLIAETLEFNLWFIPAAAFFFGAAAVSLSYSQGLAVKRGNASECRIMARTDEDKFRKSRSKASYRRRVSMNAGYYSKYFSLAICCTVCFASLGAVASNIFTKGNVIDYTGFYDFISTIGESSGISSSPFESGPVSEYFTSPVQHSASSSLNVISPGTGEQEILKVSYTGTNPIYLRGDIGVDFLGTSWTSPVGGESEAWTSSDLSSSYRPIEQRVLHSVLSALGMDAEAYVESSLVTIDYLCETSVVFLPAYTAEYAYYNNDVFDVYGDVVVRVNEEFGNVNTVECTALIPAYTNIDSTSTGSSALIGEIENALSDSGVSINSIYRSVVSEIVEDNVVSDYGDFVETAYLGISDEYLERCRSFMSESGLAAQIKSYRSYSSEAELRIYAAALIADYLRDNYTYSLTADNDKSDPVMSFLNDTKSGHCALYASAMTLLLRSEGIPARYCTGFVVDPARGDGTQILRSKNLHAWVEVYLGELGWTTFDPTSSSVYSDADAVYNREEDNPDKSSSNTESVGASEEILAPTDESILSESADTPQLPDTADDGGNSGDSGGIPTLAVIIAAALLVAAAVAASVRWYHRLRLSAERSLKDLTDGNRFSADYVYGVLLGVLAMYGLTPHSGELPAGFYKRADERFGTDLESHAQLLERIAFGRGEVSGEEEGMLTSDFMRLYRAAEKASGVIARIKLRRAVCLKFNELHK